MGQDLAGFSGLPQNIMLRAGLFISVLSALQVPGVLQTKEVRGVWPYFELPTWRSEGAPEKHPRSLPYLHFCSSGWGWTQLQCEMGTGHVHGTVATPWEHAVVQIRGKGGLKTP